MEYHSDVGEGTPNYIIMHTCRPKPGDDNAEFKVIATYNAFAGDLPEKLEEIQKLNDLDKHGFIMSFLNSLMITMFAVSDEPDLSDANYLKCLGDLLHGVKRYDEALDMKQKMIDLESDNAQYYYSLGITLHSMKQYSEALIAKRKAVDLEPDNAQNHYSLGLTLDILKQSDEALSAIKKR